MKEVTDTIADRIADRYAALCGMGFHPDTRGDDYVPPLADPASYDCDMDTLFRLAADPYDCGLRAMARAGLPVG